MKEIFDKFIETGREIAKAVLREVKDRPEIARVVEAVQKGDAFEALSGALDLLEKAEQAFRDIADEVGTAFEDATGIRLEDPFKIWDGLKEAASWLKENIEQVDPIKGLLFVSCLLIGVAALYTGNAPLAGRACGFALTVATSIFDDLNNSPAGYPPEVDNVRAKPGDGFSSADDFRAGVKDV